MRDCNTSQKTLTLQIHSIGLIQWNIYYKYQGKLLLIEQGLWFWIILPLILTAM